jgi:hypothetical protein
MKLKRLLPSSLVTGIFKRPFFALYLFLVVLAGYSWDTRTGPRNEGLVSFLFVGLLGLPWDVLILTLTPKGFSAPRDQYFQAWLSIFINIAIFWSWGRRRVTSKNPLPSLSIGDGAVETEKGSKRFIATAFVAEPDGCKSVSGLIETSVDSYSLKIITSKNGTRTECAKEFASLVELKSFLTEKTVLRLPDFRDAALNSHQI